MEKQKHRFANKDESGELAITNDSFEWWTGKRWSDSESEARIYYRMKDAKAARDSAFDALEIEFGDEGCDIVNKDGDVLERVERDEPSAPGFFR